MKKTFALLTVFILFFCCSCSDDLDNKYLSVNYGTYSATDGEFIYYIQQDGIYRATMDMEETELLIEAQGITMITADDHYLAYSLNDEKRSGSNAYTQMVRVVSLQAPETELLEQKMRTCRYIYMENGVFYAYGVDEQMMRTRGEEENEYGESSVYFCDV